MIPEVSCIKLILQGVPEVPAISGDGKRALEDIGMSFSLADAQRVKDIEKTTNHDVKAVEYFVKEKVSRLEPARGGDIPQKPRQQHKAGNSRLCKDSLPFVSCRS